MENEQIPAHEVQPLTRQETSAVLIHLNFPNALLPHQLTDLNSLDGVLRIRGTVSCSLRINAKYRNAQNFVFECKGFFLIPITLQHNGLVISGTNHLITNIDQLTEHNRIIYDAFKNDYAANNMGEKLTFISYEFSLENEILVKKKVFG